MKVRFRVLTLLVSLASLPVSSRADQMQQPQMGGQPAMQGTPAMPSGAMEQGGAARPSGGCDPLCVGMMEKERALFPWVITAGAAFTVLSIAALALLVILEILWIRLWARRLKAIESK